MSNIEPTEEQKQAAQDFVARHGEQNEVIDSGGQARLEWSPTHTASDVARFLAEREAKLRRDLTKQCDPTVDMCGGCSACVHWLRDRNLKLDADIDTLRARVAELERPNWLTTPTRSTRSRKDRLKEARERETALTKRVAELETQVQKAAAVRNNLAYALNIHEHREAQHLADIKALMWTLKEVDDPSAGLWPLDQPTPKALLQRLAHYDDAKADAPAPPKFRAFDVTERPVAMDAVAGCPKCSDDARPVSDGERWVCSVCRRPCRIPINDTEGGEG